jgi:hypothetical protein
MSEISLMSKSTWNINALTKAESVRLYDALAQSSTREEREAVLRRTIHFPYSMFSNLIKSVNDVFEKHRSCPPEDYKHACYKELKHALNDFQQDLNDKRIISDSGEPVRFTMKRTPKSTTPTPKPLPPPFLYANPNPNPLPIGPNTYMWNITDLKLRMFAIMILDRTTDIEKTEFIKKYIFIEYDNDESDIPMPDDVERVNRVISTILGKLHHSEHKSKEQKTQMLLDYLIKLKRSTPAPAEIYVLYPFSDAVNIWKRGGNKTRRKLRRSRKRSRRGRTLKGGLGPNDTVNIGLTDTYRFADRANVDVLKKYTFGTQAQQDAWELLLHTCKRMGVPVYILSAGSKIGIIRMLQLMELDDLFDEVLCTNKSRRTNPVNIRGYHNYQDKTKYQVMRLILHELYGYDPNGQTSEQPIGYLMDDDRRNNTSVDKETIQFVDVLSFQNAQEPDRSNPIYQFVDDHADERMKKLFAETGSCFADMDIINSIIESVKTGTIQILFVDFDLTLQINAGPLRFHDETFTRAFHEVFPINRINPT